MNDPDQKKRLFHGMYAHQQASASRVNTDDTRRFIVKGLNTSDMQQWDESTVLRYLQRGGGQVLSTSLQRLKHMFSGGLGHVCPIDVRDAGLSQHA